MRILILLCSLLLIGACKSTKNLTTNPAPTTILENKNPSISNEDLVRSSFQGYKTSILNDQGEQAVNFVDSRTVKYYQDILQKTIVADSSTIENLSLMDKLMVLSIRHRTPLEKILAFDGKSLLVHAIQEGMVGKNSVANNEIGEITIEDKFAKGQFVANGTPTPMNFHFYDEAGWKIDLTSIFPEANIAFESMVSESGQSENEFLFMILEILTGDAPTSEIWKPLK